jgi:hypothetical protein
MADGGRHGMPLLQFSCANLAESRHSTQKQRALRIGAPGIGASGQAPDPWPPGFIEGFEAQRLAWWWLF